MADETEFLNGALGQAGCSRIAAIDDGSVNANWCKTYYKPLRRALLRMTDWSFAGAQLSLSLDATAPVFGYTYSYGLPPDLIKIKTYNGMQINFTLADDWMSWRFVGANWKIEGQKLYSNESAAFIEYVIDITDPSRWDTLFYEMFQGWLASKLAKAIRHDVGDSERLLQTAMGVFMPEALAVDGQQHATLVYRVDDLTYGRNNG